MSMRPRGRLQGVVCHTAPTPWARRVEPRSPSPSRARSTTRVLLAAGGMGHGEEPAKSVEHTLYLNTDRGAGGDR
eukprot:scaffold55590_cov72-Phaeocystis_antarctica.AAC.2